MIIQMNLPELDKLKKDYEENGYNCIQEFINSEEMKLLNKEFDRYVRDCVPKMEVAKVYYENKLNKSTLKQLHGLEKYDNFFHNLIHNSKIKDLAEVLLEEDVIPIGIEYFNKPPGIGKQTPPHQDGYYFMLDNNKAVTAWLALEDVDEENGCIHYIKGSHKDEDYRPHGKSEILGFSQGVTDFGKPEDLKNTVQMIGKSGMMLMHHAKLIHYAGANKSQTRSRRALGFVYQAKSAKRDLIKSNEYQEKLNNELKKENKI